MLFGTLVETCIFTSSFVSLNDFWAFLILKFVFILFAQKIILILITVFGYNYIHNDFVCYQSYTSVRVWVLFVFLFVHLFSFSTGSECQDL